MGEKEFFIKSSVPYDNAIIRPPAFSRTFKIAWVPEFFAGASNDVPTIFAKLVSGKELRCVLKFHVFIF